MLKNRKKIRSIISCISIIALMVTMIPLTSFAEEQEPEEDLQEQTVEMEEDLNAGDPEIIDIETEGDEDPDEPLGSEGNIVIPEDSETAVEGDDDDLGTGTETFGENSTIEVPGEEPDPNSQDEEDLGAGSLITVTSSSVSIAQGSARKIYVTVNTSAGGTLSAGSTNSGAYSTKWDSRWSGNTIGLTITGTRSGSGYINLHFKNSSGKELGSKSISVSVVCYAKLSVSASSVSMKKGESRTVTASYSNYSGTIYLSYGTTNSTAFSAKWGSWSGKSIPLTITGKNGGNGTVYVYLKDSKTNEVLRTVSFNVYVSENAKLTASSSSATIDAGSNKAITFTASGASGDLRLSYSSSNNYAYSCNWGYFNGKSATCAISGKNAGSGTITVYLKNSSGQTLATTTVSVTVRAKSNTVMSASPSTMSLNKGNSETAIISYTNATGSLTMTYSRDSNAVSCTWGQWNGYRVPLTITGKSAGSATVTVTLKKKDTGQVLATTKIQVTVKAANAPTVQRLSYSFENFSEAADLSLCRYMFGYTDYARAVYEEEIGDGGNCFGMATSSALFYVPGNGVNVSSFGIGRTSISSLNQNDRATSSSFRNNYKNKTPKELTVKEFVMAMQTSQASQSGWYITYCSVSQLGEVIRDVEQQSLNNTPVLIAVPAPGGGGHAVLAYGVERVDSNHTRLLLYDNNYPLTTRYLDIYSANGRYTSWSFVFSNKQTWTSSNTGRMLGYNNYSDYKTLWEKRGTLAKPSYNMMCAGSRDFSIYDVMGSCVATVQDGVLSTENKEIRQIEIMNADGDNEGRSDCMLWLPVDLYKVKNTDPSVEDFNVDVANEKMGIRVQSKADEVMICADDSCNLASTLLTPEENEEYQITLYSCKEGEPESMEWEGVGSGDTVSVMMNDGNLETCNVDGADFAAGDLNEGTPPTEYTISGETDGNGTISCGEADYVKEGESATYHIVPNKGYQIKEVKVDGISVGAVSQYTFKKVRAHHTISATFTAKQTTPKATSIKKIKAAKKAFTIYWARPKGDLSGYQIQYSRAKNFKKAKKTLKINSPKKTSQKVKSLKAKKKYYVRIRTYNKVDGHTYYSSWSRIKSIKTK